MPVRELGSKAGGGTTDFGQLFLGLSMFLIIAALILTGLVFVFGVESRSEADRCLNGRRPARETGKKIVINRRFAHRFIGCGSWNFYRRSFIPKQ